MPRPARQDGRREADPAAYLASTSVAQFEPLYRDRTDAGVHLALWSVAVPNQAIAPGRQLHDLHRSEGCGSFGLDRLGQQLAGAVAQNGR